MPLCWSHAEYLSLVRSAHDGHPSHLRRRAYRYVAATIRSRHEFWSLRHRPRQIPWQKTLRIIIEREATIVWTADDWVTANRTTADKNRTLDVWFADLPTEGCPIGSRIEFTFFWAAEQRWEGTNFSTMVVERS